MREYAIFFGTYIVPIKFRITPNNKATEPVLKNPLFVEKKHPKWNPEGGSPAMQESAWRVVNKEIVKQGEHSLTILTVVKHDG